ncbi:hypothetical protein GR247_05505 [Rhizobium leguminosarum]|nr:hypothetical protein [Rhizobium leguminosarum]NKK61420.1 hypothetical protein [Rhizobium leguminosarum bv. viciae]
MTVSRTRLKRSWELKGSNFGKLLVRVSWTPRSYSALETPEGQLTVSLHVDNVTSMQRVF